MLLLYLPFTVPRATARLIFLLALGLVAACDKVPLLAPTESTITLTVSSTTVPVNGTIQVIASVTESAGTPVHNGTLVTFTGSLGTFEPTEAPTENGRAVTTFRSNGQSGTMSIGAVSGSAVAEAIEVRIGGAAADQVVVRAEPATVPVTGGTVRIVASIVDASGNPLAGAPVVFSADNGILSANSAVTDSNGEARVSLETNRDTVVRAAVGAKNATVTVRAIALPSVTIAVTTTSPEAGLPTNFTVSPSTGTGSNPIRNVVIDFGDGTQENLGAIAGVTPVSHTYRSPGQYRVTATVTDTQGFTNQNAIVITVNAASPLTVTLSATPNIVSLILATQLGLVEFNATASGAAGGLTGLTYFWDFGDGSSTSTTGNTTNHRYRATGTYTATVTVRASNGQQGFGTRTIRVIE
jgi:adhesin/invasin